MPTQAVQPDAEVPTGSVCAVKELYQHSDPNYDLGGSWSEIKDPFLEAQRIRQLGQNHAIIHRFHDPEKKGEWETHSIDVNSPLLKAALQKVFHDYPDWSPPFSTPYKPLIHRWEALTSAYEAEKDQRTKIEMRLFRKEVEPLISKSLSTLKEATATGMVPFEKLWLLLDPGKLFTSETDGNICVSKLVNAKLIPRPRDEYKEDDNRTKSYWGLVRAQVDWNGSYSGLTNSMTKIYATATQGPEKIAKGEILPLDLAPNQQEIRDALLARGRKFESLRGFSVMECARKYVERRDPKTGNWRQVAEPVSGRVVVDAHAFYHCQNKTRPTLDRGGEDDESSSEEYNTTAARDEDLKPLTDLECILAVPRVKGFDLRTKDWCEFNVDELRSTTWSDSPYENLVLTNASKKLLMAFTEHGLASSNGFDDFVKHKGKGVIFLLCGPQGVGKTLSAEAVAEKTRVPLYNLSAGELGVYADDFEEALTDAFKCCQLWGALLLLDEADVFLEARRADNLQRNELVAIFLRHLEYYQGLMFLTTNRASIMDPAFNSRVDLTLVYSNLGPEARRKVWVNFINKFPKEEVEMQDSEITELASNRLNGREIKSTLKTAWILAAKDKPLRMCHFNIVLENRRRTEEMDFEYGKEPADDVPSS